MIRECPTGALQPEACRGVVVPDVSPSWSVSRASPSQVAVRPAVASWRVPQVGHLGLGAVGFRKRQRRLTVIHHVSNASSSTPDRCRRRRSLEAIRWAASRPHPGSDCDPETPSSQSHSSDSLHEWLHTSLHLTSPERRSRGMSSQRRVAAARADGGTGRVAFGRAWVAGVAGWSGRQSELVGAVVAVASVVP